MMKTRSILMADLSGYTAMTEVHGADVAAGTINTFTRLVQQSLVGESRLLERAGDQVVIISPNADDLALTALLLYRHALQEEHFLPLHAGMHTGSVLELDGHYYGSAINLAARLAARARSGKILCTTDFTAALTQPARYHFVPHGQMQFKNILERREVVELVAAQSQPGQHIDPVCHMQLGPGETDYPLHHEGQSYYFCSSECRQIFRHYHLPVPGDKPQLQPMQLDVTLNGKRRMAS